MSLLTVVCIRWSGLCRQALNLCGTRVIASAQLKERLGQDLLHGGINHGVIDTNGKNGKSNSGKSKIGGNENEVWCQHGSWKRVAHMCHE